VLPSKGFPDFLYSVAALVVF